MLRSLGPEFIHNVFRERMMQFLADQWVVCPVFGWFVGGLTDLWMVSSFTANAFQLGTINFEKNVSAFEVWEKHGFVFNS